MEHGADNPDILPGHLRNIPDALWGTFVRSCVRTEFDRADVLYIHRVYICNFGFPPDLSLERLAGRGTNEVPAFAGSLIPGK